MNCLPEWASKSRIKEQEDDSWDHGGDGEVGIPLNLERREDSIRCVVRVLVMVGDRHVAEFVRPVVRHGDEEAPGQKASHAQEAEDEPRETVSILGWQRHLANYSNSLPLCS